MSVQELSAQMGISLPIADCTQAVLTTLDKEMRKKPKAKYSANRYGDRSVFDIV